MAKKQAENKVKITALYCRLSQVTSTLRKETPQAEPNPIKHYIT